MSNGNLNWITNFIWGIADDVLRNVYVRGKYRDVILPMLVIRRLDVVLEPTKQDVLEMTARLDAAGVENQVVALREAAGQAFYNTSAFTLRGLRSRVTVQRLRDDFIAYLDGFSPNVQEILDKFKFRNQIQTLVDAQVLGSLIEKFLDPSINLSPDPVLYSDGTVRIPALDSHAMGTIFEELIRCFNEENNEEAGEHFTPRDVVRLMADLILLPVAEQTPLLEEGDIGAFTHREVPPHVPDDWLANGFGKVGYEISFARYFHIPQPLRTLEVISAKFDSLERDPDRILNETLVTVGGK